MRGVVHLGKAVVTTFTIVIDNFVPAGGKGAVAPPPLQRVVAADGHFEWAQLDAGAYDLIVRSSGAAATAVHTSVTDGKWTDLDIVLAPGAGASGRVHAGDTPIANARIDVNCTGQSAVSGSDGSFAVVDLPATGCWTTFSADGYKSQGRRVTPGDPVDVALVAGAD
jgi:hypothetical protein